MRQTSTNWKIRYIYSFRLSTLLNLVIAHLLRNVWLATSEITLNHITIKFMDFLYQNVIITAEDLAAFPSLEDETAMFLQRREYYGRKLLVVVFFSCGGKGRLPSTSNYAVEPSHVVLLILNVRSFKTLLYNINFSSIRL